MKLVSETSSAGAAALIVIGGAIIVISMLIPNQSYPGYDYVKFIGGGILALGVIWLVLTSAKAFQEGRKSAYEKPKKKET